MSAKEPPFWAAGKRGILKKMRRREFLELGAVPALAVRHGLALRRLVQSGVLGRVVFCRAKRGSAVGMVLEPSVPVEWEGDRIVICGSNATLVSDERGVEIHRL